MTLRNAMLAGMFYLTTFGTFCICNMSTAAVMTYTNIINWQNEAGGSVFNETFESVPTGLLTVGTSQLGLVELFTDDSGPSGPRIQSSGLVNGSRELFGRVDDGTFGGSYHIVTFPFDIRAFSGEFSSTTSGNGLAVRIGTETLLFSNYLASPGNGFLGFKFDQPVRSITFLPAGLPIGEGFSLDNLRFARVPVGSVPEPTSLIIFSSASLLAIFIRRDRRISRVRIQSI